MAKKSFWFWGPSSLVPGFPLVSYIAQQAIPQYVGESLTIPWGWLTICGMCIWIGYLVYDVNSEKSVVRDFLQPWTKLAKIVFQIGMVDYFPSTKLTSKIHFFRHAENVVITARLAFAEFYIDGTASWKWTTQTKEIVAIRSYNKGEEIEYDLLSWPAADNSKPTILGIPFEVDSNPGTSNQYMVEINVTSAGKRVKAREYFRLMCSQRPFYIPQYQPDIVSIGENKL